VNDSQAGKLEPGGSFTMGARATRVISGVPHLRFQDIQTRVYTLGRLITGIFPMDKHHTGFNQLLVSFTAILFLFVSLKHLKSDDCARKIHFFAKRQCVLCYY
jgi:hypothetical protein